MKPVPNIIWLASWYPTRLDAFTGDFIQRHARALALQVPVHVFHVIKDTDGIVTKTHHCDVTISGQLKETIVYYHPRRCPIPHLNKVFSLLAYYRIGTKFLKQLLSCLPNAAPFIVDVQIAMRAGILARWLLRTRNIHYCITEHWTGYYRELSPLEHQGNKLFWKATGKIFSGATFLRTVTHDLGHHINSTVCQIPFRKVPNVVDTRLFQAQELRDTGPGFTFIHPSTLGYQKNVQGMLDVFEKIGEMNRFPLLRLRLLGEPPADLVKRVNTSAVLSRIVSFGGMIPYAEVAAEMKKAQALILFSRFENLPCVMLEALCCGLPVIATNVGGVQEELDSNNGILVESEDNEGLEAAIIKLMEEYGQYDRDTIATDAGAKYGYENVGKLLLNNYYEFYPQYFENPANNPI